MPLEMQDSINSIPKLWIMKAGSNYGDIVNTKTTIDLIIVKHLNIDTYRYA